MLNRSRVGPACAGAILVMPALVRAAGRAPAPPPVQATTLRAYDGRTMEAFELLEVRNGAHEALTVPAVQDAVVDWFNEIDVRGRQLQAPPPRFTSVEEASRVAPPGNR